MEAFAWVQLVLATISAGSLAGAVWYLRGSPWADALRRLADLERAFPAWQAEMSRLATSATEAYAEARAVRDRMNGALGGEASGAARRRRAEPSAGDLAAAEEARLAAMTPHERREAAKAAIAARYRVVPR